jgi:uncharacterized protein (DUF1501 family)
MNTRREFLFNSMAAASLLAVARKGRAQAGTPYRRLVVLVELKGGNDGLNTVVPFADPRYQQLRPRLALERDTLLHLSDQQGLHPALEPLLPQWRDGELAVVMGLGYPRPNLSHFRSIEIWDTASRSDEYLDAGWLARAFASTPAPRAFATEGVVVGSNDMGPLSGAGARVIALSDTERFLRSARLATPVGESRNAALAHILKIEQEITDAAARLHTDAHFKTEFPRSAFGNQIRTAAQLAANRFGIGAIRLSLGGFDTHANQQGTHANLLRELAEGLAALKGALMELDRWNDTLVMTYAEFGRRPKENQSGGTDHGTANAHLVMGGRVRGGLYGEAPALGNLDGNGNLPFAVDFRALYATVLRSWWGLDASRILGDGFAPLDLLRG